MPVRIPLATYRLQLNRDFGFAQAAARVPALSALGISHLYCSPFLKARPGSTHGYDIVDHSALNPELGSDADYARLVEALRAADMGLILDFVPNHMGVGGGDNPWWLDVLENGQASDYAGFFDIDWLPAKYELRGKVLLPLLEDHYGRVLEAGLLRLEFDPSGGSLHVAYHEHRLPLDPGSYAYVLTARAEALTARLGAGHAAPIALAALARGFADLPTHRDTRPEICARRREAAAEGKRALAELCRTEPAIAEHIEANVGYFNGRPGEPASFDLLHALLEEQPWRPAFWRVAADEINYRRFFDVNTLAALRMERAEVFAATHRLVLDLIARGELQGLRLDHPDGLTDPAGYYRRLQQAIGERLGVHESPALYTVVEKILAPGEPLPADWPVHGTTGYEFAALADGVQIHPDGEAELTRLYGSFTGRDQSLGDLVYENKRLVMRSLLSGELMVLANHLDRISETDRHTRDYTLHTLRDALMDVIACFPVYRSYCTARAASTEDRRAIERALRAARRRSPAADPSVFDFLARVLLPGPEGEPVIALAEISDFILRFQQYTAPVMAKGMEDTTLYVYNRFVSLNEVGADPRRFGVELAGFHRANADRAREWPHSMLAGTTHDCKRSADVRARLNVLSELPQEWRRHVGHWSRSNRARRRELDERAAPSRNDEYLLYQTLLGAWPLEPLDAAGHERFTARIQGYMLKAAREAKTDTSWINPDAAYEAALAEFVAAALDPARRNSFLEDFEPFARRIARFGLYNSLSQALMRLTAPGVPDLYQGHEIWDFSLVDPDNRRPVDYARRELLFAQVQALAQAGADGLAGRVRLLLNDLEDGRALLWLQWRALGLRRAHPALFQAGDYLALETAGARATHLVAFARRHDGATSVTVAPRWFARLAGAETTPPLGEAVWADSRIEVPQAGPYRNVLTGEAVATVTREDRAWIPAAAALARFPAALLWRAAGAGGDA